MWDDFNKFVSIFLLLLLSIHGAPLADKLNASFTKNAWRNAELLWKNKKKKSLSNCIMVFCYYFLKFFQISEFLKSHMCEPEFN